MKKWFIILNFAFLFYDPTKRMVGLEEVGNFSSRENCEENRKQLEADFTKRYSSAGKWWISPRCHHKGVKHSLLQKYRPTKCVENSTVLKCQFMAIEGG